MTAFAIATIFLSLASLAGRLSRVAFRANAPGETYHPNTEYTGRALAAAALAAVLVAGRWFAAHALPILRDGPSP